MHIRNPLPASILAAALGSLLLSACNGQPTAIGVNATLSGTNGVDAIEMNHSNDLSDSRSILFSDNPNVGAITGQVLTLTRTGTATNTGYEFLTIFNEFTVGGGGGIFRGASAGDASLFRANTGRVAKTSYYYFEDSGEAAIFNIAANNGSIPTKSLLVRVKKGSDGSIAKIPFTETGPEAATFLSVNCLTSGTNPCFDMSTLIGRLFTAMTGGVTGVVNSQAALSLGGSGNDGDFTLDYIPSMKALRGCGNSPAEDTATGFVFGATISAPLGSEVRIRIPLIFSATPDPGFNPGGASVQVHPFEDVGSCQETQFINAITVHASTFFGIGAQTMADETQKQIVCSLFGPTVEGFDCTGIAAAPIDPIFIAVLGAMFDNTLTFYWRKTHGQNSAVPGNFGLYLRPRNADNRISSTNVTPGDGAAVQVELVIAQ